MSTKYIIIENEYFAFESLKNIISQANPEYQLVFSAESVEESVAYFKSGTDADLIFMDIELVDGNCFDIFNKVEIDIPVIFTTAYNEFAIQAFKVNSVDYILKPVSEQSIAEALKKFEKIKSQAPTIDYKKLAGIISGKNIKKRILLSKGDTYSYMDMSDVAYFISEDKYVFIYTFSGSRFFTEYSNLNQVEEDIDPETFFRVSRNIVTNLKVVSGVRKFFNGRLKVTLTVAGKSFDLVVSSAKRKQFLNWLGSGQN